MSEDPGDAAARRAPASRPVVGRTDDTTEHEAAIRAVEAEFLGLVSRFRRIVAQHAEELSPGLLPGAYKVFSAIARRGPLKAADLAERMMLDKGQLSRTITALEERGLITRSPDPADRRAQLLEATPDGLARLEAVRGPRERGLFRELLNWPVEDVRALGELLHALVEGAPGTDEDDHAGHAAPPPVGDR